MEGDLSTLGVVCTVHYDQGCTDTVDGMVYDFTARTVLTVEDGSVYGMVWRSAAGTKNVS
eukprot:1158703-Pelagomonas_calceolata.AAC.2